MITGTLTGTTATFVKDQNADSTIQLYNANAGAAAQATIYVGNSSAAADGLFLGANGTGMTTAGGFVQDGAAIGSGTGAGGGLSIMTRATADMRFYTDGHTNERMRITSGGNVCVGSTDSGVSGTIDLSVGLAGTTTGGITLWSTTTGSHSLGFGDGTTGTDGYEGYIEYDHNDNSMQIATNHTVAMTIDSSGILSLDGSYLKCNNVDTDKKIEFNRTGGNVFSIEHDTNQIYLWNATTGSAAMVQL